MDDQPNALGNFLRARRDLVTPEKVGIAMSSTRRVPGLRREEVAMLAGVSAQYYLRLEQGRDRRPSAQVLESIAHALLLDDEARDYLAALASDRPRRRRSQSAVKETVPSGISKLLRTLGQPAFVEGRYTDVLAANSLAVALSPRLTVGANRLRDLFLDPAEQAFFSDWEGATRQFIAGFRNSVGADINDPRFIELVGELSLASPRFRALWARQDVKKLQGGRMRFDHPQVGSLDLNHEKLAIPRAGNMMLVILHPDPQSHDAEKLSLLASASFESPHPGELGARSYEA
ncbi:helix-turn-helix domain-containing protein [Streptomyces sp. NPDC086081]|uniref:helix-turn-helix domain-containing protein n=1 Tax=Streptomyces sp. NPDC086081 TaxID=3365749 RepID=UPI0037F10908